MSDLAERYDPDREVEQLQLAYAEGIITYEEMWDGAARIQREAREARA
jgi:hypothetical protein